MVLKDEFINIINDINNISYEYGYRNGKDLAIRAYEKGKLLFDEKEEVIRFIQMRNMLSHGGASRINIFKEDITKLKYYKNVLYNMLGVLINNKIMNAPKEKIINKQVININNISTSYIFNNSLTPRFTNKSSDIIRNLFIKEKGIIHISTLTGLEYDVYLSEDGESFETIALPIKPNYTFQVFDVVYNLLMRENGKVKKGNGHSYRLGETGCSEKTVCGCIGYEYAHKNTGDSVFDPVFIICAIMDYAGICRNTRGYLLIR